MKFAPIAPAAFFERCSDFSFTGTLTSPNVIRCFLPLEGSAVLRAILTSSFWSSLGSGGQASARGAWTGSAARREQPGAPLRVPPRAGRCRVSPASRSPLHRPDDADQQAKRLVEQHASHRVD